MQEIGSGSSELDDQRQLSGTVIESPISDPILPLTLTPSDCRSRSRTPGILDWVQIVGEG